jgi:HEAT repeat protein
MAITPESVQKLLNSPDFGDRIQGLNQLRQLDSSLAFGMIQPLIRDANPRVRYAAVSQLDSLGKENLDIALELLRDRLYNDSEVDVQAAAADAIGGLKLTAAFEDLQKYYQQTSEWLLKFSILAALGELGDPRGFSLLEAALTSDNTLIQTAAISSLGELGDGRAIPLLLPFAENEDWQIRYRLAQSLGHLGTPEIKATLEKLAEDSVAQVAEEAKHSLTRLGF